MRDSAVVIVLFAMAIACAHLVRPAPAKEPVTRHGIQSIEEMTADRAVFVVVDHDVVQRETWVRTPSGWRSASVTRIR